MTPPRDSCVRVANSMLSDYPFPLPACAGEEHVRESVPYAKGNAVDACQAALVKSPAVFQSPSKLTAQPIASSLCANARRLGSESSSSM
jgi:hypothetical protein